MQPAVPGNVPMGYIIIRGGRCNLFPGLVFHKHHSVRKSIFVAAVIFLPHLQPLPVAHKFLCRSLHLDPGIPVPRPEKHKSVPFRQWYMLHSLQVPLQQQLIIFYSVVVIVKLQILHPYLLSLPIQKPVQKPILPAAPCPKQGFPSPIMKRSRRKADKTPSSLCSAADPKAASGGQRPDTGGVCSAHIRPNPFHTLPQRPKGASRRKAFFSPAPPHCPRAGT